jgi:hypothetical protein
LSIVELLLILNSLQIFFQFFSAKEQKWTKLSLTLPIGSTSFPFEFTLPHDLPPSLIAESNFGRIIYSIAFRIKNFLTSAVFPEPLPLPFFVKPGLVNNIQVPPVNINLVGLEIFQQTKHTDPRFQLRILMKEGVNFFVPGERIHFELETNNSTTVNEKIETCVKLKRSMEFCVKDKVARTEQTLACVFGPIVPDGESKVWRLDDKDQGILIQEDTIPSGPPGCRIISVQYFIQVKVRIICFPVEEEGHFHLLI